MSDLWEENKRRVLAFPSPCALALVQAEQELRAELRFLNLPESVADKAIDLAADLARYSNLSSAQAIERLRCTFMPARILSHAAGME